MLYAKKTEPLLGCERANKGSLDVPLPKQVDANGFGLDELEEDASMAEKPTGLDTKTVTLWTASHSVSQMMEESRNCWAEKATSVAERANSCDAQALHVERLGPADHWEKRIIQVSNVRQRTRKRKTAKLGMLK